jgi:hypothetical protein
MNLSKQQITDVANSIGVGYAEFMAFLQVESNGIGFKDGRIVIQFEPHLFSKELTRVGIKHTLVKKKLNGNTFYSIECDTIRVTSTSTYEANITAWKIDNGVEGQNSEYKAFSKAFQINPDAAMKSTSIGAPQILGMHYARLGFKTVGAMWESFKESDLNQVKGLAMFIKTDSRLHKALRERNWHLVATYYNGGGYLALSKALKFTPYNIQMANQFKKYSS